MNKSTIFKSAHNKARLHAVNCAITGRKFNYQVVFSFYLKEIIADQPMKMTTFNRDKTITVTYHHKPKLKINKACAMVGDYTKPTITIDGLKVHHKKSPSLVVTYNLETLLMLIMIVLLNPFSLLAYYVLYANFF